MSTKSQGELGKVREKSGNSVFKIWLTPCNMLKRKVRFLFMQYLTDGIPQNIALIVISNFGAVIPSPRVFEVFLPIFAVTRPKYYSTVANE